MAPSTGPTQSSIWSAGIFESSEWSALIRPLSGTVVVVNTPRRVFLSSNVSPGRAASSSRPPIPSRSGSIRCSQSISFTALTDPSADLDKNGRISIWEAFASASAAVRRYYQQRGQLSTERALLDDNGDGVGKDPGDPGDDGSLASRTYLDESLPGAAPTDEVLLKLLQRKAMLEADIEEIEDPKTSCRATSIPREFERLMIELAQVSHDIRARTKI